MDRLKQAQGDRLLSVILYGSAAAGEHNEHFSDLNVLCVLTRITPAELAALGPIFEWWRALGNPSPLLLSEEELRTSTDCFPIEFHDMQERRRVLFGKDRDPGSGDREDLLSRAGGNGAAFEAAALAAEGRRRSFEQARAAAPDDRFGSEFPGAGAACPAGFGAALRISEARDRAAPAGHRRRRRRHSIHCSICGTKASWPGTWIRKRCLRAI